MAFQFPGVRHPGPRDDAGDADRRHRFVDHRHRNLSAIAAALVLSSLFGAQAAGADAGLAVALAIVAALAVGLAAGVANGIVIGVFGLPRSWRRSAPD
jgi:hypothetical protein